MQGMEGFAAAILLAMVLMVLVPALVGAGLFRWVGRTASMTLLGAALGAAAGIIAVAVTFWGETLTRPSLHVQTPPDFAHAWIVVIEDARADRDLRWEGLLGPSAVLEVPASGVVRVRTLPDLVRGDMEVTLPDGRSSVAFVGRPGPPGLGGSRLVMFGFTDPGETGEPDLSMLDEAQLVDSIRRLEAGEGVPPSP